MAVTLVKATIANHGGVVLVVVGDESDWLSALNLFYKQVLTQVLLLPTK
jgi:hypothetical protein